MQKEDGRIKWLSLTPFLSFHLRLWHAQFEDNAFGEFHQSRGTAGIKDCLRQVFGVRPEPGGIDSAASAGPPVICGKTRAGDVEFEIGVLVFELPEFVVKNDVV